MRISGPIAIGKVSPVSWKNGGGVTRTLAAQPEGAGMNDFLWRVSVAEIHQSGGFSCFPGIDRTILLWRGEGMLLQSPAWPDHALTKHLEPFRFCGEDEVTSKLFGSSSADLNVMVRRGAAVAEICTHDTATTPVRSCDDLVVLCAAARIHIQLSNGTRLGLEADEFLRIAQPEAEVTILPASSDAQFVYAAIKRLH